MFAQESVMGIKKEREAFERLPLAELAIESEFVFYNEETNSYWPNEDFCPSDAPETMNFAWEAWQAAKAHEAEKLKGCVLVPVQCPDPDFADSLFDELSKKAIGEFGDDLLIHFSDIDEEKIWALMVEAAKAQAVPKWIETAIQPPEEGQKVIISGIYGVGIAEFSYLYKDEFVMYDMGASNPILSKDQVKFWQPLPDAPQEPAK